jgi:CRP/FNR family transcriptional regulator, cyclic AMP receptor protein
MGDSDPGREAPHLVPPEWRQVLVPQSRTIEVRAGQVILSSGGETRELYIVLEGSVRIALFASSGREVAIREMGAGELFGELAAIDGLARSATVVASTDGKLAVIPTAAFFSAIEQHPQMALWLLRRFAAMIRASTGKIFELGTLPARNRLHCELLRLAEDGAVSAEGVVIAPAPTHADFAARIGSHREMVTREFGTLSESGALRQFGRRLVLLDLGQLMQEIQSSGGNAIH